MTARAAGWYETRPVGPVAPETSDPHLDVLDALDGAVALTRRSPTLDGSVPLRVVQGCVPLLEGNAAGLQLVLRRPWRLRRRLGAWRPSPLSPRELPSAWGVAGDHDEAPARRDDALLAARADTLASRGIVPARGHWHELLRRGVAQAPAWGGAITLATGLLVRPRGDVVLRVSGASARASARYDVEETWYEGGAWVPLVLEVVPRDDVDELVLEGEVATLTATCRGIALRRAALDARAARAHLDFYDARYFAAKREGEVTRKYRREVANNLAQPDGAPPWVELVTGGPDAVREAREARVARREGVTRTAPPATTLHVENEVDFEARWDGQRVWLAWDRPALEARAREIEARWAAVVGALDAHRGALWYLTKYFTPHPPGEPHLFTKPAVFVRSAPGLSSLVEGVGAVGGAALDVLRGVVQTDTFHAVPTVYGFRAPGVARVSAGATVARIVPTPRELLAPRFRIVPFDQEIPP